MQRCSNAIIFSERVTKNMEALALKLMSAVPALAGVPLWVMTLLVMVVVAAVLLVFALTFGGLG
ncbi:MAG: hypothetical protein HW408_1173, partial [Actinobacteria bacterium]|nr:hypothetical protein [Actinomycetota bacterium]